MAAANIRAETESTLNVTSLLSPSQSLYDSDINNPQINNKYNKIIDDENIVVVHNNSNHNRILQKKSSIPTAATNAALTATATAFASSSSTSATIVRSTKDKDVENISISTNTNNLMHKLRSGGGASAATILVHGNDGNTIVDGTNMPASSTTTTVLPPCGGIGNINATVVNSKTATILVSKTKTKTGLPLLLKNSIN